MNKDNFSCQNIFRQKNRIFRLKHLITSIAVLSVVVTTFVFKANATTREAVIANISKFNEPGRCDCMKDASAGKVCSTGYNKLGNDYADYLEDRVTNWYSNNSGSRVSRPTNKGVNFTEWADDEGNFTPVDDYYDDEGNDDASPYGVDSFDYAFLYTHGNTSGGGSSVVLGSPDDEGECNLEYGSTSTRTNDVYWGDNDLNFMMIHACQSLNFEQWQNGGYDQDLIAGDEFSMLLGFHGTVWSGPFEYIRFASWASGVQWNGLGEDWVVELTSMPSGSDNDNCATALVYADNEADAEALYYDTGFEDTQSSHRGTRNEYFWKIVGCDPKDGAPIPL